MPSVVLYVQHLLGIGHLQRSLRIAEALVDQGVRVTLVSGGMPAPLPRNPAIEFVQLAPTRARDARYELIDCAGSPIDDAFRARRSAALLSVFERVQPDALVIEGFPFARRAFRFELEPLLAAARVRVPRPRIVCSVRDIVVVRDDQQRHRDIVERVRRDFDAVLVHADPALITLNASFAATSEIADRILYTGYVSPPRPHEYAGARGNEVVVSAGGGAAGFKLLSAALEACRGGCLSGSQWRLLTGSNLPEDEFAQLRAQAPANAVVHRFQEDLAGLLCACRVSVSQAGYNTVLDILSAGARAVLVPFAAEREIEQLIRAERLAALGAAELLRESELSGPSLTEAIERAAARAPGQLAIDMYGAARSAGVIAAMIASRGKSAQELAKASRPGIIDL